MGSKMLVRGLFERILQSPIDLETPVVICDRNMQNRKEIHGVSVFHLEHGRTVGLRMESDEADYVSAELALQQLSGLSFPIRGGAHDHLKRMFEQAKIIKVK